MSASRLPTTVLAPGRFAGRAALFIRNHGITVAVLPGGGHICAVHPTGKALHVQDCHSHLH